MHLVGRINRNIYECVTRNIRTDEVIITEERIEHIKRTGGDYFTLFGSRRISLDKKRTFLEIGFAFYRDSPIGLCFTCHLVCFGLQRRKAGIFRFDDGRKFRAVFR